MTRASDSPRVSSVWRTGRSLVASTLLGIWLCSAAAGQEATPTPPDLLPLTPDHREPPSIRVPAPTKADFDAVRTSFNPRGLSPAEAPTPGTMLRDTVFKRDGIESVPLPDVKPWQTPQEQSRANLVFAEVYWKQGNVDRALSYYEAATQLDPENVPARIGRAWAFAAHGDTSQALAELDSIIKLHPESSARVYATRAQIRVIGEHYDNTATFDKAAADVERALKLDPMEPGAQPRPSTHRIQENRLRRGTRRSRLDHRAESRAGRRLDLPRLCVPVEGRS